MNKVRCRAIRGFKFGGRGVRGAYRDEKGGVVPGEEIDLPVPLAYELRASGSLEFVGKEPPAEKLSTKSAGALKGAA